jgi:hypothetical protein
VFKNITAKDDVEGPVQTHAFQIFSISSQNTPLAEPGPEQFDCGNINVNSDQLPADGCQMGMQDPSRGIGV